jgi:hypothetical protein
LAVVGVLASAPPSGADILSNLNLPSRASTAGTGGGAGNVVTNLVGGVANTVTSLVGGVTGAVTSALPSVLGDPTAGYIPTLDNPANPHGEGTVASVSLGAGVIPAIPGVVGTNGQIVVGRTLGEYQTATKQFHGHITLLSLFGQEILGVDTLPGQSSSGVLGTQQSTLGQICAQSMQTICLKILNENSTTTTTSSTNHIEVAGVGVGAAAPILGVGPLALADAAYSDGNISVNPSTGCETTHGDAHVGDLSLIGLTVHAIDSQSNSTSCNNPANAGSAPTSSQSTVANLGGSVIPLVGQIPLVGTALAVPIVAPAACSSGGPAAFGLSETGTPNVDSGIPALLPVVCNADDTNPGTAGSQATIPYTAREALTAFVLSLTPTSSLVKVTASASQASSTAPGTIGQPTTGGTTGTPTTGTPTTGGTTGSTTGSTTTAATPTTTTGVVTSAPSSTTGSTTSAPSSTGAGNSTGSPSSTGSTGNSTGNSGNTATAATPKAAATLPFTGFNVLWLLVGGMTMLVSGLTLRRFGSRQRR